MQAIFWSVFNAGEQVSIIFLDSQIFDQVLDIFPWLSYWFTFIMLNVGMVDNLEFWYTIFLHSRVSRRHCRAVLSLFFALIRAFVVFLFKVSLFIVLWIYTSNISPLPLCRIRRDQIKDQIKHEVNTNRLVSEIHQKKSGKIYLLLDSPNVHPQLKKSKRANLNCKWCISLLIEHWQSGMDFNFAGTTASKESTRCVKSMCAGNTK